MNELQIFDSIENIDKKWSESLKEIESLMPEIKRGVSQISKRNSQTMTSLMTLNMIDSTPYRVLSQILIQIDIKYSSLVEIVYKLKKKMIQINNLKNKQFTTDIDSVKAVKYSYDINNSKATIENLIREIGALQQRYREVIKNKNIPEDWTEKDFEEAEVEHHIKSIFRNAIRDRMAGGFNVGTMEYMEQFGIEPIAAYSFVDGFISVTKERFDVSIKDNKIVTIDQRYQFYDDMYENFKEEFKRAMKRIGLDSIHYSEWLMKENK